jgi:hypothetical protein
MIVVPSFSPTANAKVDALLLDWRRKVFIPAAVEPQHRELMYKGKMQKTLTEEPGVTVKFDDGEEIKLEPLNPLSRPKLRSSLYDLASAAEANASPALWENLLPFLRGLKMAQYDIRVHHPHIQRLVRRACRSGRMDIVMQALNEEEVTGVSLKMQGIAQELFMYLHDRAAAVHFGGPEMAKITSEAEALERMMQDQLHKDPISRKGETDPRHSQRINAVLLGLYAEEAIHKYGGQDEQGKVLQYAKILNAANINLDVPESVQGVKERAKLSSDVNYAVVIENGLRLALQVSSIEKSKLGESIASKLGSVQKHLKTLIELFQSDSHRDTNLAYKRYQALHGSAPGPIVEETEPRKASPAKVGKHDEQS